MTNSFTQVFGGTTIYPADVSYLALALTGNISLEWPLEATAGSSVVARIIDITPSGAYTITMPEATSVSVGQTVLFNNIGPSTVAVNKANGSAILSIGAGEQWQAYLIDNTTPGGTWRTLRYGAATAQAQAAALAGPGLVTDGSQLAQNYEVIDFSVTPYTLTAPDRAKVFIWDGGLGTLNLPSAPAAGDGWFVQVRNAGQGDLTVDPSGSELINAGSTLLLQPGDSAVIVSNGTQWYTIGLGQQAVFAFDYTSIAVTGGTYTLSGSELNRIAYKFTGALASNVTIVVPATVQQYWVNNSTTGPFTLSLQASGSGSSTPVTQSSTSILYCDGTAIVPATTAVTFAGILPVSQGGTGANNAPSARTNLGATGIGSSLFTATSAASARSTISAASSGANSDITSLSGLTTPLSVGQGGTGAATLTANGVVVGNGASAVQVTAAGTTGQVLVGNTGGAPSWATLTGIGVTSFSGGTTGLTPASPTTGAITLAGTLGVANGGTGTATAFTAGSVVFAGASGVYSQDNANLFWDNANDRLGIGTATPATRLSVAGTVTVTDGTIDMSTGYSIRWGGAASGIYAGSGTQDMVFTVGSSERMRVNGASGNVGIGTSTPANRLQVSYTSTAPSLSSDAGSGLSLVGSSTLRVNIGSDPSFPFGGWIQASNGSGSSFPLTLNPLGGNVGIGTSNPLGKLHIDGNFIRIDQSGANLAFFGNAADLITGAPVGAGIRFDNTALRISASSSEIAQFTIGGNFGIGTTSPAYKLHVANGIAYIENTLGYGATLFNSSGMGMYMTFADQGNSSGVGTNNGSLIFYNNSNTTERMRIDGSGNVGIGTSVPGYKLDVAAHIVNTNVSGGIRVGAVSDQYSSALISAINGSGVPFGYLRGPVDNNGWLAFYSGNPSAERMRITSAGLIGIGTVSPTARVQISGTSTAFGASEVNLALTGANGVTNSSLLFASENTNFRYQNKFLVDTGALLWQNSTDGTNYTERMRLTSVGYLGLGTASPANAVEIAQGAGINAAISLRANGVAAAGELFVGQDAANTAYVYNRSGLPLIFGTANAERMRIASDGKVGIGTSTPLSLLVLSNGSGENIEFTPGSTVLNGGVIEYINRSAFPTTRPDLNYYIGVPGAHKFYTDTFERMRIDASGNVGIGVTPSAWNADYKVLQVGASGSIAGRVGTSNTLDFTANGYRAVDGNWKYTTSQPSARFAVDGSVPGFQWYIAASGTAGNNITYTQAMTLDSLGNVGIGTASPSQRLDIVSSSGSPSYARMSDGTVTFLVGAQPVLSSALLGTTSNHPVQFWANNSERMRIDSSGNVGIGTSSVQGGLNLERNSSANTVAAAASIILSNRDATSGTFLAGGVFSNTYRDITTSQYTAGVWFEKQNSATVGATATQGAVIFGANDFTSSGALPTERMRIAASGNVGIGTTSPLTRLHVSGGSGILVSGNGASGYNYAQFSNDVGNGVAIGVGGSTASGWTQNLATVFNASNNPLAFGTNNTERMRIDSSGNVGIGTSSPGGKLEVLNNGTALRLNTTFVGGNSVDLNPFVLGVSNAGFSITVGGNIRQVIDGSGNVGIGTSSPANKFVVSDAGANGFEFDASTGILQTYNRGTSAYTDMRLYSLNHRIFTGSSPTEKARINASGDFLVGTTDAGETTGVGLKLFSSASIPTYRVVTDTAAGAAAPIVVYNVNATNNGYRFYVKSDGGIANFQANNVNLSDERLKDAIVLAENYLDKICSIPVKSFKFKDQSGEERTLGVIAQDVDAVAPELVDHDGFGETLTGEEPYLAVYQTDLQYALMKCIQELKAKNDELTARVAQLEGK